MSRAYRISVKESERRVLKGSDHVRTSLEMLEVLPKEEMAGLLAEELKSRGFVAEHGVLSRTDGDTVIRIDPITAELKVCSEIEQEEQIEVSRDGTYYDETPQNQRNQLEATLKADALQELDAKSKQREKHLTQQATEILEKALRNLQGEMDSVVNKVTAKALKQKAAQLGNIKEITEDEATGSLTIVLEV